MYKWRLMTGVIVVTLAVAVLAGGAIAIGDKEDMYTSHMRGEMGDEMRGDEGEEMMVPCVKGPGMKGHMMGKPMAMKGMPMMHMWGDLKERLDLTDEQTNKFRKIYNDYRKEVLRKRADIEIAGMDLDDSLKAKGSSEKAIEEGINKLQALKSSLNSVRVKALLKTRDFLSDEQYEELTSFILGWNTPHRMRWSGMPWSYGWDE